MTNLTILVDVDNVLEDLNTAWVNAINEKYGTSVIPNEIFDWDIQKFFPTLTRNQVFSPLHTEEFWENLKPLNGSQKYLKQLIEDGHKIVIVTSAHPDTIAHKHKFISRNFPFIPFKNTIITSQKQLICGDVMIDDAPHNLKNGSYRGILMSASHNINYDAEANGFIRLNSWAKIYQTINQIAKEREKNA